jgi:uncharacterized membrane protein
VSALSYYEILLFLHVGAAAIWIGSAFLFFVLFQRAKRSGDPLLAQRLGAHTEWLAKRLFIPSSLSVLVLGILLTIEGPWSFDQLWILLGLAGMASTFLIGLAVIEPTTKKMHAAIETHGPAHPEVARQNRRLEALGFLDLTLLFAIVWDMVLKPTTDDVGTLLIAAVVLAAAGFYLFRSYRATEAKVPPTAPRASEAP